jgi:hypothetical protein
MGLIGRTVQFGMGSERRSARHALRFATDESG